MINGDSMTTNRHISKQEQEATLESELQEALENEAVLNLQTDSQEGTWAVEEARARLKKFRDAQEIRNK